MDERTAPSAAFALRLTADLFTALILQGIITKEAGAALLADSLKAAVDAYPEHEQALREIAATVTVQTGLASVELDRKRSRDDPSS